MSEYNHQPHITLLSTRCFECGRYWAYEKNMVTSNPKCPFCADISIAKAYDTVKNYEKTISALRGVISRMKGKNDPLKDPS